jgi:hypothetical protein
VANLRARVKRVPRLSGLEPLEPAQRPGKRTVFGGEVIHVADVDERHVPAVRRQGALAVNGVEVGHLGVAARSAIAMYRSMPDAELAVVPGTSHRLLVEKARSVQPAYHRVSGQGPSADVRADPPCRKPGIVNPLGRTAKRFGLALSAGGGLLSWDPAGGEQRDQGEEGEHRQ